MEDPIAWLKNNGAQNDVVDGLRPYAEGWRALYEKCPRGDWLLGIAVRIGVSHAALVRAASACARISFDTLDEAPAIAAAASELLAHAEGWARSETEAAEVARAVAVLEEAMASAGDPAVDAAARAALAAGMGVSDRDVLTGAPASAAEAWMMRALDCGLELAMRAAHDKCASAVRAAVDWNAFEACLRRLT